MEERVRNRRQLCYGRRRLVGNHLWSRFSWFRVTKPGASGRALVSVPKLGNVVDRSLISFEQLGICQCMTKCMCKMCWRTCEAYCSALGSITCYCCRKINNTRRVYRGSHLRDVETGGGFSSDYRSADDEDDLYGGRSFPRKRKLWERRDRVMKKKLSLYTLRRRRRRRRRRKGGLRKTGRSRSLSFRVGSRKKFARMSNRVLSRTNQGRARKKTRTPTSKRRRIS